MIPVGQFAAFDTVPHAVTTRHGGVSSGPYASLNLGYATDDTEDNVAANRRALLAHVGIAHDRVVGGWLTHGNAVSEFHEGDPDRWPVLRRPIRAGSARSEAMFRSDGVVSDVPGLHFVLTFADCVPILFADADRGIVGGAHAGWRGTAAGIGPAVVQVMIDSFGSRPQDIVAAIGPSIGPCCYSVGGEVLAEFSVHGYVPAAVEDAGTLKLDLWESNARQLAGAGIARDAIEISGICTACHTDLYFSHRAEGGVTGRFAAIIGAD